MITYILSHPIQYFSPLLKQLAKETDIEVYYFSDSSIRGALDKGFGKAIVWDTPLLEGYPYRFLKNYSKATTKDNRFWDVINPGVINSIRKTKSKIIVVNGWSYSSFWLAIIAGRIFGKEIWLRAENPLNQELCKSKKTILLKKIFLKHFLFRFLIDKFLFIGRQSKLFFEYYGVSSRNLIFTPYAVDNHFFQQQALENQRKKEIIRKSLGIRTDAKVILFSGKYISKKRPLDLIRAYERIINSNTILLMVGEGKLRTEMEAYIKDRDLKDVILTGFVNQSEISKYYAIADVFVMCSGMGETWGLSVNEAMNFSLPVIVSDTCGCSYDLVKHGENGFVFKEGDIDALCNYLNVILQNNLMANEMGQKSLEIINDYSILTITRNILLAI